ncbi:MAG TPA: FAD/NAD(P)-binding oxidoreductase [Candidatus Aminicenantes bacterium]|nr:FAD/NAD(P)-binding oxidoreductase [Candidatus Aminicenantes bacterium]
MKRLLILGAGTAGTIMANLLRRRLPRAEWAVTVVDRDNDHYYQPGFLFVPFGFYGREDIVKPRSKFLPRGVEFIVAEVDRIDPAASKVLFQDGSDLPYDYLIVATGASIVPSETPGMLDGWRDTVFDFYTADGAEALGEKLKAFPGGRIVIHVNETPIKCPVAPLEFAFFCDDCLRRHRRRDQIDLVYVTPLDGAFTKPVASKVLGAMLAEKRIEMVTEFNAERVDAAARKIVGYDGREVPYDLLVTVPTNMGSEMIERSGMGDEFRFLPTDPKTLRSKKWENIFAIGDATDLTSSKAGSVAHFQAEILAENLVGAIEGKPLEAAFDGHSNCFIEAGKKKAILIDFNYDVEPLPGMFPFAKVGPMPLLKPSRINHIGKAVFRWIYWHVLLPGRPIPFVPSKMKMAGKKRPVEDGAGSAGKGIPEGGDRSVGGGDRSGGSAGGAAGASKAR